MHFKFATAVVLALSAVICVSGAIAQDMQPGRGGGSFVETDPIATPLANAALDGVADGSGVSNAAAFRSALSLGTAATADVGVAMGNLVALGLGSMLPAVNASQLTGITSSQVSGLGTMAAEAATSYATVNASNVADAAAWRTALDVSQAGTSPYAADTWDYSWTYADGDPTSLGWTQTGTQTLTVASDTISGVNCYSLTPSGSSGTSWIGKATGVSATGSWEMRAKIYWPASSGTAPRYSLMYNPDATASNSKRFEYSVSTAGPSYWNATAVTTLGSVGDLSGQWIDITWRHYKVVANDVANYFVETWVGPVRVSAMVLGALGITNPAAGSLQIGRSNIGTQTAVTCIASIQIKNGINAAPPSYTFRSAIYPL